MPDRGTTAVADPPTKGEGSPRDVVRLNINLSHDVADLLAEIRERQGGVTATEAIRRAISVLGFFTEAKARGGRVLVEEPDGSLREVVFPY